MKDFSIVIAHRGDAMGLWATIHSCEIELANSGFDYEYCFCINGEEDYRQNARGLICNPDIHNLLEMVRKTGRLGYTKILQGSISPPNARQLAAQRATGKLLFFFDNHCLVDKNYFARAVADFDKYDMDMLHSTTKFFSGDAPCYHYKLKLEKNFWAEAEMFPDVAHKPYRIAAGGHGGFIVKRSVWEEVGGYWDGFVGYGGEEMYFDLKMAMLGKNNFIDPKLVHYHYAGKRPYARHYTDDYYRNMMACANIIGGESWMYRVFDSFSTKFMKQMNGLTMYDLLVQAEEASRKHASWFAGKRLNTLDEQLQLFNQNQIAWK